MGVELQAESQEDVSVQLTPEQSPVASQPAHQPASEKLDANQVREAMRQAAEQGIDPFELTVGDLKQGLPSVSQAEPPVVAPEKFKKPNGEVDVEKLKASTKQLDEAIQEKKAAVQKSIDDYIQKQKEFRNLPNVEKLKAASTPPPVIPPAPSDPVSMSLEEIKAKIAQDLQRDAPGTVLDLVQIAVNQRLSQEIGPLKQDAEERKLERQDRQLRENLTKLAENDPRVLQADYFNAINATLEANPELWNLKNPHKAAWLEVKEELRLGEPSRVPAQPSRPPSPILGGGTPPPTPSSSEGVLSMDTLLNAASQIGRDPRDNKYDPKQADNMRKAAKELFDRLDRQARR